MPNVHLGTQVFDLAFNPKHDIVYTGLLNGHVKAFSYDDEGACTLKFDIRPTKKTARSLATSPDGLELYNVSKDRSIHVIDTTTGKVLREQLRAHECAINRVTRFMSTLATGDDDGVIKFWDSRQLSPIKTYTHHSDFISDFLWLEDKKQLVVTSGDGTLSVLDVRSSKTQPFAQSEDQEDELLSIVSIKEGAKVAVGTQTGIISLWNRSSGWKDCVDRIKGHPHSVDALASLSDDVIVTGSSDGLVRVVQVLPHKLLGVIADHGTFPIERLRTDRNGAWLGSASHDDVLKLTDVRDALVDSDEEDEEEKGSGTDEDEDEGAVGGGADDDSEEEEGESAEEPQPKELADAGSDSDSAASQPSRDVPHEVQQGSDSDSDSDSEPEPEPEPAPKPAAPKKRKGKEKIGGPETKKGKIDTGFFDEL